MTTLNPDDLIVHATAFTFYGPNPALHAIMVEQTHRLENAWAVRFSGRRVSTTGVISYEPSPLFRDDDYILTHTFNRDDAISMALMLVKALSPEHVLGQEFLEWISVP